MWRDTAVWLIVVAVLIMGLSAGCGKSKKAAQAPSGQWTPGPGPMPPGMVGQRPGAYGPMSPGMPGQRPGAYGQQAVQPALQEPAEPEEVEPSGPSYRELYAQGELTAEELREEHKLQKVERELGYPVGP